MPEASGKVQCRWQLNTPTMHATLTWLTNEQHGSIKSVVSLVLLAADWMELIDTCCASAHGAMDE